MRKFVAILVGAVLATSVSMTSANACARNHAHLKIDRLTGAIVLVDPSPIGNTPPSEQDRAVLVTGTVTHCGSDRGLYESGTLTQGGKTYQIGGGGLGQGELSCSGNSAAVEAFFLGDTSGPHVGRARVHLVITDESTGAVVARGSRTVRIPSDDTGL